jgi:hypothetical protein
MSLHYCIADGYLVDHSEWLPSEPFDYAFVVIAPYIGCNNLRCANCGKQPRGAVGLSAPRGMTAREIYALLADPARAPQLARDAHGHGRLYACECYQTLVFSGRGAQEPLDLITEERSPWTCQGHPPLALPARLDGIDLSPATDWKSLAREVFSGARTPHVDRSLASIPGFWMQRLYGVLDEPMAAPISRAVSELLLDPDESVRRGALFFFRLLWSAPGAERVAEAARDHASLFSGPLWDLMVEVLNARMTDAQGRVSDVLAMEQIRQGALRPPGIGRVIHALAALDEKWVLDRGEQILLANPAEWKSVLYVLRGADPSRVARLAREALDRGWANPEAMRQLAERHFPDPLKQALSG